MVGIVRHSQSENLRKLFALPSLVTGLRGPNSRVRAFISVLLGGQPRSSKLASTKNRAVMDVTDTSFRPLLWRDADALWSRGVHFVGSAVATRPQIQCATEAASCGRK